jgi:hypothetical protein
LISLEEFVQYGKGQFNKRTLTLEEGTPLPATFVSGKGQFTFVVHPDLSVTFNGKK